MKRARNNYAATRDHQQSSGELLILPDGRILAHNITPALAQILTALNPSDDGMRQRAGLGSPAPASDRMTRAGNVPSPPLPPLSLP